MACPVVLISHLEPQPKVITLQSPGRCRSACTKTLPYSELLSGKQGCRPEKTLALCCKREGDPAQGTDKHRHCGTVCSTQTQRDTLPYLTGTSQCLCDISPAHCWKKRKWRLLKCLNAERGHCTCSTAPFYPRVTAWR